MILDDRPPMLIGLGGPPGAGKDALAEFLRIDHGFEVFGMSDPLVDALLTLNPIISAPDGLTAQDVVARYGYVEAKARYPEFRRLLRVLGTEVGRQMLGPDTWLRPTANKILAHLRDGVPCAVTGIRFPNDLDWLVAAHGHAVWVDRPGVEGSTHDSDTSLGPDDFSTVYANTGTLDDLRQGAGYLLDYLRSVESARRGV